MFSFIKKYLLLSLFLLLFIGSFTLYHINKDDYLYQMYKQEYIYDMYNNKSKIIKKHTTTTLRTTESTTLSSKQKKQNDISCYNITEGDALPSVENATFSPPNNSIFFHETSCSKWINSRQACSIESAAKAHPKRKVYVLFSGPITKNILYLTRSSISELKKYPNIEFLRVHLNEYLKNTPVKNMFTNTIAKSKWKIIHTADLLRIITLYKYGGLFLDTDVIVLKPMDSLGRNWVAKESYEAISSAVVDVAKDELGREILKKVLEEIESSYNPKAWLHNGPEAIKRVLVKFCNTSYVEKFSEATCHGFRFFDPELFYPVAWFDHEVLLKPGPIENPDDAYTFHFWNQLSSNKEVQADSPLEKLARVHCPVTHNLYGDSFGF